MFVCLFGSGNISKIQRFIHNHRKIRKQENVPSFEAQMYCNLHVDGKYPMFFGGLNLL